MIRKEQSRTSQLELSSAEEFVPQDHLLRKIDAAVDFKHIYDFAEDLYCKDNGRPRIDPVVFSKWFCFSTFTVFNRFAKLRKKCVQTYIPLAFRLPDERENAAFFNSQFKNQYYMSQNPTYTRSSFHQAHISSQADSF